MSLVQTPNSVVGHEAGSNAVLSGGSVGAAPNSSDSLFGAVVQTPISVSCVDGAVPNSSSALNNVNFKETIDLDNEDINDNAYEASSEGLLSDDESSDNESDNEKESSTCINKRSENVVPSHSVLSDIESSANMEIGTENVVPSTNPASSGNSVSPGSSLCGLSVSSGGRSLSSKLPFAVGKGSGSSISAKIPRAPGAGVHKAGSSGTAGRSAGLRKATQDWSMLSKRRK